MRSLGKLSTGLLGLGLAIFAACSTGDDVPPGTGDTPFVIEPAPAQMRRLLARQYVQTVRMLLGDAAAAFAKPPPDEQLNGFQSIAASQFAMNDSLVRSYEASARDVAAAAVDDVSNLDALVGCTPVTTIDEACYRTFIERFARHAFRRPLVDEEVAELLDLGHQSARQLGDFYAGIEYIISAILQSPSFLFQVEIGEPHEGVQRLTGLEMATRMSFFLTDTGPSEVLLDAALAGELDTTEGVERWAKELVEQPTARLAVKSFFDEYLVLTDLRTVAKDPNLFPEWSPDLAQSMRGETLHLVEDIVFNRNAPVHELLTATYTFVDSALAAHYGVTPPAPDVTWTRASLPADQGRSGILSHASILSRQAHATSTSATYRGLFIMERFLCTTMPPPPPDVNTELPPSSEAPTLRERIAVHQEVASCRACHYKADNLGLSLENFDAIGHYRETENGAVIDASGELDGETFDGVQDLGALLASRTDVLGCMMRQLYRHGTGHVEVDGERKSLDALEHRFAESGYRMKSLLVEIASSELFRTVGVGQ